jgi:hypothetical protein
MDFQQSKYTIDSLIQRIKMGKLGLPEFQRDFVWEPREVVDLLDSVSRQWPIGSLLLLSGPQPFAFRTIDSGPVLSDSGLDMYILDGQQRVTALYHAIANVSDSCYYIDFNALIEEKDDVFSSERRSVFEKKFPDVASRASGMVALVADLWEITRFYEWMKYVPANVDTTHVVQLRQSRLGGLQSKVYHVFAIELEQDVDLEALARIFETINRKGVDLDAFDLLVAKLYGSKFFLKVEWEKAREQYPILYDFDPEGRNKLEILKILSLIVRTKEGKKCSRGVRQGDLLALSSSHIRQYWASAVDLMAQSLTMAKVRFGVTSPDLLPNWSMIHGLAGFIFFKNVPYSGDWWISSILHQTFAQAANTKVVSHWDALADEKFSKEPVSFNMNMAIELLSKPALSNGLLNKGLNAMINHAGALDPLNKSFIEKSDRVIFRSLGASGFAKKLKSGDKIATVFMCTPDSDKKMGRQFDLNSLDPNEHALATQGFLDQSLERSAAFLVQLISSGNFK